MGRLADKENERDNVVGSDWPWHSKTTAECAEGIFRKKRLRISVSGAPLFCHMCIKHLHMSCQVFSFGHLARNMFRHTSLFAIEKWSVPALPVRNVFSNIEMLPLGYTHHRL